MKCVVFFSVSDQDPGILKGWDPDPGILTGWGEDPVRIPGSRISRNVELNS